MRGSTLPWEETMPKMNLRAQTAVIAFAGLMLYMPVALAETVTFKGDLKASSEVPPNDSKGTGSVTATYDTSTKSLAYTITYSDLTGTATAAHFHGPAAPGVNAPVLVPIPAPLTSPIKGTATLTDAQAADLEAGTIYFNIHTEAHKGGEIRGQMMK
jgi:CHRD domain